MKNWILSFMVLFLISSPLCWGDGKPNTNSFADYANSREASVESPVGKSIDPIDSEGDKKSKHSDEEEDKSVLLAIPSKWQK